MATGDRVIFTTVADAIIGDSGAGYYGEILVGTLNDNANPTEVVWDNGETLTIEEDRLRKLLDPPDLTAAKQGKWLQMIAWPALDTDQPNEGTPKSPGMSGVCVQVQAFGLIDSSVVLDQYVQVQLKGGVLFAAKDFDPAADPTESPPFQKRDGRRSVV